MKKIIGMIRPFDAAQTFMVYDDGNKIDACVTNMEYLSQDLFVLMDKHDTYKLDLVGPKKYLQGISEQIQTAAVTKYADGKIIDITII
jgi:hypothetical protein